MKRLTYKVHDGGIFVKESDVKTFEVEDETMHTGNAIRKLAEYEDLEEQGLLLKLPCKVGDTVYFISEKVEKQGRRKVTVEFIDKGEVDNITLGSTMTPQITVCDSNCTWTTFDSVEDFGKTVFLTQAEAEEALERMEEFARLEMGQAERTEKEIYHKNYADQGTRKECDENEQ